MPPTCMRSVEPPTAASRKRWRCAPISACASAWAPRATRLRYACANAGKSTRDSSGCRSGGQRGLVVHASAASRMQAGINARQWAQGAPRSTRGLWPEAIYCSTSRAEPAHARPPPPPPSNNAPCRCPASCPPRRPAGQRLPPAPQGPHPQPWQTAGPRQRRRSRQRRCRAARRASSGSAGSAPARLLSSPAPALFRPP